MILIYLYSVTILNLDIVQLLGIIVQIGPDQVVVNHVQIVVHKTSPRGTHFRRAGPRQRVDISLLQLVSHVFCSRCLLSFISQVYFESDEVRACIVTCGGLCPGLNTVIREIVCGLHYMYGVTRILGIDVSNSVSARQRICFLYFASLVA